MVLQTQDKEAATKWIQNPSEVIKPEEPAKLKIGENVKLDIKEPPIKAKKVNFSDNVANNVGANNVADNDNFLSLLKRKEPQAEETNTLSLLREILEKQNQILNLLTKN